MMTCALLAKSPNWASKTVRPWRSLPRECPYSKPSTAASLSGEFHTSTASCIPVWISFRDTRLHIAAAAAFTQHERYNTEYIEWRILSTLPYVREWGH